METVEKSLKDEAIQTLVLTTAATVGMWGGTILVAYIYGKIKNRREAKGE